MKRLVCFVLGHKYHVIQRFSKTSRRVECLRCKADWGMNDSVRVIIPWSGELEEMYELLGHKLIRPRF